MVDFIHLLSGFLAPEKTARPQVSAVGGGTINIGAGEMGQIQCPMSFLHGIPTILQAEMLGSATTKDGGQPQPH